MNWLLGGGQSSLDISIALAAASTLPQTYARTAADSSAVSSSTTAGQVELQYLLTPQDAIAGTIHLKLKNTHKKFEHQGIKLFLIGSIEFMYDRSNPSEFLAMSRDFEPPGELYSDKHYAFDFGRVIDKSFETYHGNNVRLRYYLKVKVQRSYVQGGSITKIMDLSVQNLNDAQEEIAIQAQQQKQLAAAAAASSSTSLDTRRSSTTTTSSSTAAASNANSPLSLLQHSTSSAQDSNSALVPSTAATAPASTALALASIVSLSQHTSSASSIKMEVGIEDCLHIEFEYSKNRFHLSDCVIGRIFFLLVRIKIKHMELVIIKRESCGVTSTAANAVQGSASSSAQVQPNVYNESENISKFEIMDGAPVRGESIPIRLFLAPYALTPTYRNIGNKFSVRYYLNLVLVDEEDRRYFKQQEIILWRKQYKTAKPNETNEYNLSMPA